MSGYVMFEHVHGAGDHPHCPVRVVTRTPTGDLGAVPMQLGQLLRASLPHEQGAQRVSQGPQAVQTRTTLPSAASGEVISDLCGEP
jgi:hypothetical protein